MKVTLILKKSVTRYDTESQATSYDQSESLG